MKNFLLIDDHAIVRRGIGYLLIELHSPCNIDEAENETLAIEKIKKTAYDLIFLDINLPENNTLNFLKYILIIAPEAKALIFSMNTEKMHARRYIEAGAKGFLSKDSPVEEIKRAVHLVLNNRNYYSETFIDTMMGEKTGNKTNSPIDRLSEREFEILNLLICGKTITQIAGLLNIQTSTIGTHKAKVFEKLNVKNLVELIEFTRLHQ